MAANYNVTASIANKKDRYYIIVGYYVDGKRKQKWIRTDFTVSGNNKRKVEQKRLEVLREWQNKVTLNDNDILFSDYLKSWLEETKHTIAESTYFSYKQTIHNVICPFFEARRIKLCDLKPFHIQEFYTYQMNTKGVSANSVFHYHANIHKCLNHAVKTERLQSNPSDRVDLPRKQKHIPDFYTADECKKLLEHVQGTEIEPVILLATWYGLRRGEIIGLRWVDIDFDSKVLHVRGVMSDRGPSGSKLANMHYVPAAKTSSSIRSFPMSDSSVSFLKKLKSEQDRRKFDPNYNHQWNDFICVRNNGNIILLQYVSAVFPKLCLEAGLKRLKLHELRHTNISLLLESGANMKELQEWAGHGSYHTTANIYSHIQAKSKSKLTSSLETMLENG